MPIATYGRMFTTTCFVPFAAGVSAFVFAVAMCGADYRSTAIAVVVNYPPPRPEYSFDDLFPPADSFLAEPPAGLVMEHAVLPPRLGKRPAPVEHAVRGDDVVSMPTVWSISYQLDVPAPELIDLHRDYYVLTETGNIELAFYRNRQLTPDEVHEAVILPSMDGPLLDRLERKFELPSYRPKVFTLVPLHSTEMIEEPATQTVDLGRRVRPLTLHPVYFPGFSMVAAIRANRVHRRGPPSIPWFTARFHYRGALSPELVASVVAMLESEP